VRLKGMREHYAHTEHVVTLDEHHFFVDVLPASAHALKHEPPIGQGLCGWAFRQGQEQGWRDRLFDALQVRLREQGAR
jgi:hypothetical protein